ncbi:MAG: hypothetical protein ABEI52_06690 [Halobacteriaceae archaeon]
MRITDSPADAFLSYIDGERSLEEVWEHPAYEIARNHADLLGRELDMDDVVEAIDGGDTSFRHVDDIAANRENISTLQDHVDNNERTWVNQIERQLGRITPEADFSDVPVYLAIGYEFGIGTKDGAFINLNEPLFFRDPRQLLYTAIHECSHVIYDRVHDYSGELDSEHLTSRSGQQRVFRALFHTEAYATHSPVALRRADGNLGSHDHLVCADYRVFDDESLLRDLVAEYDSIRRTLRTKRVDPNALLSKVFGESRLPYRVGCVLLDRIERTRGIEAVREGFHLEPKEFLETHDDLLDEFRTGA